MPGGFPTKLVIHDTDELIDFQHTALDQDGAIISLVGSTTAFRFGKPDGSTVDVSTSLFTDGLDGVHRWQNTAGFFTPPGAWKREAHIETAGGLKVTGDTVAFVVAARLPVPV